MNNGAATNFKVGYTAIVGRPNVGKSTLLNHLLNFKVSAVTRKPQTTRHQVRGILTGESYQIIFLDTPGLLEPKYKLQEAMVRSAQRSLSDADVILFMLDATRPQQSEDDHLLSQIAQDGRPLIVAINKIDRVEKEGLLPLIEHFSKHESVKEMIPISALRSDGLDRLIEEIVRLLPFGQPLYSREQITDHPERFIASEIIREKIFQRYGEEIPYAITVEIDEFKERPGAKDFIQATIYVERASQKGILIGKKGVALRELGKFARQEIEAILGRSIFLELWVKVKAKWRQDEKAIKEFGY